MQSGYKYVCRLQLEEGHSSDHGISRDDTQIQTSRHKYLTKDFTPMTSFTPLSFPAVGLASHHDGQFGERVRMGVRRFSTFVSSAWRDTVRDSSNRNSIFRRFSKIVYGEEETEETSSREPSPLDRRWSQQASMEAGLRQSRRDSLSPSVSVAEIRNMSPGNHPDE